jgi:TRAP-type C4-dicarboxylate transport system permease small subunit
MSTPTNIRTDDTWLSRLDRGLFRIESAFNLFAGLMILSLVIMAVVHVLSRKFFNAPVPGFVDWVEQFMAIFAFIGISYCQRLGGHIRMDMLIGKLRGRVLWFAELLASIFMILLITALIYGTYFHFLRSFDINAPLWSRDSTIDIALPLWPAKLLVPIAFSVLWLRLALQIWGFGRALRTGEKDPVAVPLIEDAAALAAHEAEAVS